ncbi:MULTISPECIES: ATP-binding protein [unclassified Rhodococcus (in: high G+C Gram-positive bacteria)]|uniref:ATP-binding protein n=1 Tax=unclassified Rhodococcus (in: high G+C Gram-positive bacteria) TaxID=192944 RepID=UPI000A601C14|nr:MULTISPECIES: ATP-binding protein [unclassified Rhodococcus (in: high G+C Gram-positive bacteria)]
MTLYVITGPPAAGKSTWVREHATHGDIVIDYDLLANTLTVPDPTGSDHDHTPAVKAVAKAARKAAIDKALTLTDSDTYLIHSTPSPTLLRYYRDRGAEIITVDPGIDVVMARARKERPWWMQPVIKRWYDDQAAPSSTRTTASPVRNKNKELGRAHREDRARLLRAHHDGDICWWCGLPMFKSQELEADHSVTRDEHARLGKPGRPKADRLLHGLNQNGIRCNRSRGDGTRDHLRPALTGKATPTTEPAGNALDWG